MRTAYVIGVLTIFAAGGWLLYKFNAEVGNARYNFDSAISSAINGNK